MPRAPSEKAREAHKLFKQGKKLVEIAEELHVPAATVRRWKFDHKWTPGAKKKQTERSDSKANETERKANVRKRGGQPGNVNNAGGHGNPHPKIPNASNHEAYSRIYWDSLDPDEKEMIEAMPKTEEDILEEQIRLFSVRERRIMKAIDKYRKLADVRTGKPIDLFIDGQQMYENKRKFKNDEEREKYDEIVAEKVENRERLPGESYSITTFTQCKDNIIIRLEHELSTVQEKKQRAVQALIDLHLEKERMHGSAESNELLRTWAQKIMEGRRNG